MNKTRNKLTITLFISALLIQMFSQPLSVKSAELFDTDADVTYTVEFSLDGTKISSSKQQTEDLPVNGGILLAPGQQIQWVSVRNDRIDSTNTCHHSEGPDPIIHSESIGLKFTSAKEEVSLESLGEIKTKDFEIITGGKVYTNNSGENTQTKETITVDDSFTAGTYVYVKYLGAGETHIYAEKCEHNNNWNTYYYGTGAKFSVQQVQVDSVSISFDTDGGLFSADNYPTALTAGTDKSGYSYEIPKRIGYEFDGWDFQFADGKDANMLFTDSKEGSFDFAGMGADNWEAIDKAGNSGITAVAKWKEKMITIRYNPNGGVTTFAYDKNIYTFDQGNIAYESQKNNPEYFKAPNREGYDFDGWYLGDTKLTTLSDIPAEACNNEQLYEVTAKYTFVTTPSYEVDSVTRTITINDSSFFEEIPDFVNQIVNVVVKGGITEIPNKAFYIWKNLASLELPEGIISLGKESIYGLEKLKSLKLPEGLENIGVRAFYANSLEELYMPASVKSIDSRAFIYSANAIKLYYAGSRENWEALSKDLDPKDIEKIEVIFTAANGGSTENKPDDKNPDDKEPADDDKTDDSQNNESTDLTPTKKPSSNKGDQKDDDDEGNGLLWLLTLIPVAGIIGGGAFFFVKKMKK